MFASARHTTHALQAGAPIPAQARQAGTPSLVLALAHAKHWLGLRLARHAHSRRRLLAQRKRKGQHRLILFHRLSVAHELGCRGRQADGACGGRPRNAARAPRLASGHGRAWFCQCRTTAGRSSSLEPKVWGSPSLNTRRYLRSDCTCRGARVAVVGRSQSYGIEPWGMQRTHVKPGEIHVRLAARGCPLRRRQPAGTGGRTLAGGTRRSRRQGTTSGRQKQQSNRAHAACPAMTPHAKVDACRAPLPPTHLFFAVAHGRISGWLLRLSGRTHCNALDSGSGGAHARKAQATGCRTSSPGRDSGSFVSLMERGTSTLSSLARSVEALELLCWHMLGGRDVRALPPSTEPGFKVGGRRNCYCRPGLLDSALLAPARAEPGWREGMNEPKPSQTLRERAKAC